MVGFVLKGCVGKAVFLYGRIFAGSRIFDKTKAAGLLPPLSR
jgi:hypothetical protein